VFAYQASVAMAPPGTVPRAKIGHPVEVSMQATLVSRNPEIMSGALVFTGTRVLVKSLFDYLEGGESIEEFLDDFPTVEKPHATSVLEMARETIGAYEAAA
jgi:uncharacterized protein (DUF433 family)